ncbi:putative inorganic phosphate cotransporter [Drosophila erecta]|uniref:putative inorganic phosphate cotransporter n=1 Tax=Drosophila erecta TaxID=7220 RepID=UPI0001780E73|nr:putative inorganic phosphate cotransporter [Drosophila erecta]
MTAEINKGPLLGMRHVQTLLIFFNITILYIGRLNVGVSVVAMTNADSTNPHFPEYDWSLTQRSFIISSFFWGYIITQFLGGYLCKRYGVKSVLFCGSFASGVFSALTPLFISFGGWQAYCGIRVLMGCAQGLIFPCIYQHLARWSPPAERNRLGALSHTGIECGNVSAMFLSGMIAKSAIGWPGISYVSAGLAFAWCAFWFIFAANNALESRYIGEAELHYIESSLEHSEDYHKTLIPVPWMAIFTSTPFLALIVTRCCETWGLSTLQAQIPTYMNGVLGMDMKSNAFFSALPFLAMWIMSYVYLITSDFLLAGNRLSLTALRKTFNSLAFWIPCATLIGIGFLDMDQKNLAIALMTISVGVNSGATIGSSLNTIDLSPNHASILMGIVNTAANVVPIVTPLIVAWIVQEDDNRAEWQIVFIIAAVIFFIGNCVFLCFGTAVSQPWDAEDYLAVKEPEHNITPAFTDSW